MITKNIFKIHILFYLIGFICIITGHFKNFIIFTSIIIIHESGHILAALFFKWKIEKVILLPFGGLTIFNERIDKPLYQEFIIAIMGPIFQIIFYNFFKDNDIFNQYNKFILLFNLLPIYPLDGSKLINVLLNKFLSFKLSHKLTMIISLLFIFIIIIKIKSFVFLLIILFIVIEVVKQILKHKYYFNKFLLERYLYKNSYNKIKYIKNIKQMKKQTKHILITKFKLIDEDYFIKMYFNN